MVRSTARAGDMGKKGSMPERTLFVLPRKLLPQMFSKDNKVRQKRPQTGTPHHHFTEESRKRDLFLFPSKSFELFLG
jgi:hypothetical protein